MSATAPKKSEHKCILISGISGCGKTTVGQNLATILPNTVFIDGDQFYLKEKPKVTLSDGTTASNWDCAEAIDWGGLNAGVRAALEASDVVLATFLPLVDRFAFPVTCHARLLTVPAAPSSPEPLTTSLEIQRCLAARAASKGFASERESARDELMVREVVYPVHVAVRGRHPANLVVNTYGDDGARRPVGDIVTALSLMLMLWLWLPWLPQPLPRSPPQCPK